MSFLTEAAPALDLPVGKSIAHVRMFNTTTDMVVGAEYFVEPIQKGHEYLNLPTVAFLIENKTLGKKILFDLGSKRDYWNFSPAARARLKLIAKGLRIEKGADQILLEAGVRLEDIS